MKYTVDNLPCYGKVFVGDVEISGCESFNTETRLIEFYPEMGGKFVETWSDKDVEFVVSSFTPYHGDECKFVGEDGTTVITF